MSGAVKGHEAAHGFGHLAAENEVTRENEPRLSSLASQKFRYEDIVNADPECLPSALKIVRAYLNYVTDFNVPVFVPTLTLRARTNLSTRTITDMRRLLVELGYFEPAGKTARGSQLYRLTLRRESIVLDHILACEQTYRERDIDRKRAQQAQRKTKATKCPNLPSERSVIAEPTVPDRKQGIGGVIEDTSSPKREAGGKNLKPVIEENSSESLEDSVEESGSEERSTAEAETQHISCDLIDELVAEFGDPGPPIVAYWREKQKKGAFSPQVVLDYWAKVRGIPTTDPVLEGLKRSANFFG